MGCTEKWYSPFLFLPASLYSLCYIYLSFYIMVFITLEGKLYKIHLRACDPFLRAMDDDFHMIKEFEFIHPEDVSKDCFRHYVYVPANGNAFLMIGECNHPTDSACVRIVLNSVNYGVSYMVIYDYQRCFSDADLLAEMIVRSFNEAMKGSGEEMTIEPWDTKGEKIMWFADSEVTYNRQLHETMGKNVSKFGYEEVLAHYKKMKAKNDMRKIANAEKKKERFDEFIEDEKKVDQIMTFVHETLKTCKSPRMIGLTFRLLKDLEVTGKYAIPYGIVMKAFAELENRISDTAYYFWVNKKESEKCEKNKFYLKMRVTCKTLC